ncbi:DUF6705 family protein [Chryseobacterium rhizosphaerae]|uniref:DUF6705 domain-containing protein n=1 Tax=Chryseobacterium rhizosphaerae TaxID=395937 RepID=A0ABX9IE23_9FLAO|nr:DUF6705 family protein [Chryseobacterium rhizosphaerae]REC70276.1 hypothetical protein DRF57_22230 [Chryseobacterium rhizosphaerae]
MKNIVLILIILLSFSCKAQSVISLEQAYEYSKSPDGLPESVTYVKDINNRLDQFVGTWKGSYGGKNYEFQFIKKINFGEYSVKWDEIIGRFMVKDNAGNVLYNTLNEINDNNTYFWGARLQNRAYEMSFVGNYDCLESGSVYIEIRINNTNEMKLFYSQDKDGILNPAKCPNFNTYVPLLPTETMILTRQ